MDILDAITYTTGGIFIVVVVVWLVCYILSRTRKSDDSNNNNNKFLQQITEREDALNITSDFIIPVTYHKIQKEKPWKLINTNIIKEDISGLEGKSQLTHLSSKSTLKGKQKDISSRMLSDLKKQKKYITYSTGDSNSDSKSSQTSSNSSEQSEDEAAPCFVKRMDTKQGSQDYVDSSGNVIRKQILAKTRRSKMRRFKLGHKRSTKTLNSLQQHKLQQTHLRQSFRKTGKISFETQYHQSTKQLNVKIQKLSELIVANNLLEDLNIFVSVYIVQDKHKKRSTSLKKRNKAPVYNEVLSFNDMDVEKLHKQKMRLKVYNHSELRKNELIGEVNISLAPLDLKEAEFFNVNLFHRFEQREDANGRCLVSICHEAAKATLTIKIDEVKELPKIRNSIPDPYTVVRLYKANIVEIQESETQWNTCSPHFKQSFHFHLSTDFEYPLGVFSLVVSIANRHIIGRDEVIGHMIFSLDSPQSTTLNHWKEVVTYPQEEKVFWHYLLPPEEIR